MMETILEALIKKSKMIYITIDFQSVTNAIGKNIFFNNYVEHAESFR